MQIAPASTTVVKWKHFSRPRTALLLQAFGEVGNHLNGLADLLGKAFEQEFVAVIGNVEKGHGEDGPARYQREQRHARKQFSPIGSLHRNLRWLDVSSALLIALPVVPWRPTTYTTREASRQDNRAYDTAAHAMTSMLPVIQEFLRSTPTSRLPVTNRR